jgi:hypothetical protein
VTTQAPINPIINPINGLEMANQSGIASRNGSELRRRARERVIVIEKGIGLPAVKGFEIPATSKELIVFMASTVRNEQIATTARVWDFLVPP